MKNIIFPGHISFKFLSVIVRLMAISVALIFYNTSIAQANPEENVGKRLIYEESIKKIQELEDKAQYHGDDPVIRQRLNLPPRLPSFEEWINQNQSQSALEDKKSNPEKQEPKDTEKNINDSGTVAEEKQNIPNGDSKQDQAQTGGTQNISPPSQVKIFRWGETEIYYIAAIFFSLLMVNFLIYSLAPRGRWLLVAIPFDIFAKGKKSDSENAVKWRKYFRELLLLIGMLVALPFMISEGKSVSEEDINAAIIFGLKSYAALHVGYVIIRMMWGASSRCPKCGTPFGAVHQNTWDEAKLTYQKPLSSKSVTMEKGTRHSEYRCAACNHQWTKQSQYEKQLTY